MEESQVTDGATQQVNDQVEKESKKTEDVVAYSTYSKVMGTLKKRESELNEVRSRLESIELEKKQAEGNKDEVISTLREKLKEAQSSTDQLKHQYVWSSLEGQIKTEAVKHGCRNPDKLMKLLNEDDLKSIQVGNDFKVNQDDLNRLLEKAKKDNEDIALFQKKSVNINDVAPKMAQSKSVKEMNAAEVRKMLLEE
jgi:hypothetical protein